MRPNQMARSAPALSDGKTLRIDPAIWSSVYHSFRNSANSPTHRPAAETMTNEAQMIGYDLLKTGALVAFRIVEEEVVTAPADEAEFGMRVQLKFVAEEGEEDRNEDEVAESTAEWGSFGFMFLLAVLSFAEAKPRNSSLLEYEATDELRLADFMERLRFVRGELHYDADYIRGRRIKTRIAVRSNGTVTVDTIGRGKSVLRWLERVHGKKRLQLVDAPQQPTS
jgi:hypothetical protein